MLQMDIDRYGQYARLSNVADLLELGAVSGRRSISPARVADWLDDLDLRAQFDLLHGDTPATSAEVADFVFEHLSERARALGKHYPFSLTNSTLRSLTSANCPYFELLGLTVAHAHDLSNARTTGPNIFEELVTEALTASGWKAHWFGANRGKFDASLRSAGITVGLKTFPDAAVRSRASNDEGVDVIAKLPMFHDERDGNLIVLAQATLEKSSGWEKKASQVKPNRWKKYLRTDLSPIRVFATPYHVEELKLRKMMEADACIVFDRLRLAQMTRPARKDLGKLWGAVKKQKVELW